MTNLIRAEARKLRTTQTARWLIALTLGLNALSAVLLLTTSPSGRGPIELGRDLLTGEATGLSALPLFLLGLLAVPTEHRHRTLTPTLLATPSRRRHLTAKGLTLGLVTAATALLAVAVRLAIALPWLHTRHEPVALTRHASALVSGVAAITLFTLVGLGLGAIVRNQAAAVAIGLLLVTVVGTFLIAIPVVKYGYPYLPAGAFNAALAEPGAGETINEVTPLNPLLGLLMLATWSLVTVGLGTRRLREIAE